MLIIFAAQVRITAFDSIRFFLIAYIVFGAREGVWFFLPPQSLGAVDLKNLND